MELIALVLVVMLAPAIINPAGVADYNLRVELGDDGQPVAIEADVYNSKNIGMIDIEYNAETGSFSLTELEVNASEPAEVQAGTAVIVAEHIDKLVP